MMRRALEMDQKGLKVLLPCALRDIGIFEREQKSTGKFKKVHPGWKPYPIPRRVSLKSGQSCAGTGHTQYRFM
jgi:hypothetical protein